MPPSIITSTARVPITTTLTILPCLLAVSTLTLLQHLYSTRRHLSPIPVRHPILLFRDPRHCLSHPANRVFSVRADRNILASAPLACCFFEPTLVERDCRYVGRVRRGREERGILRWMMRVKKQVDGEFGVGGVLPWGSEVKGETRGVGAEWVRRIARGLRKRWGGDVEAEVGGWFEVWEGVIVNRCTGWVVEPEHLGLASLEDDDEGPFTWVNSAKPNLKIFDGAWVAKPREKLKPAEVNSALGLGPGNGWDLGLGEYIQGMRIARGWEGFWEEREETEEDDLLGY